MGGFALLLAFLTLLCPGTQSNAASGPEIDASVRATLNQFFHEVWSARDLANQATAILVFPTVVKAALGSVASMRGRRHSRQAPATST